MLQVAIVDDDDIIRAELRKMLEAFATKCEIVLEAEDGDLVEHHPLLPQLDLILTDINMRRMGGIELIRSVKKRWPKKEMIVLSNYDDFMLVRDAMKYGASDYLLKYQLNPETLHSLIELCIQKKERGKGTGEIQDEQMRSLVVGRLLKDFTEGRMSHKEVESYLHSLGVSVSHLNTALFLIYTKEEADVFSRCAPGLYEKLQLMPYCFYWERCPGCLAVVVFHRQSSTQLAISENYLFAMELLWQFLPDDKQYATICRSETVLCLERLPQEMEKLSEYGSHIFYLGTGMVLDQGCLKRFTPLDQSSMEQLRRQLLSRVKEHVPEAFENTALEMLERMRMDKYYPDEAREFLIGTFRRLCIGEYIPQEDLFFDRAEKKLRSHLCTMTDVRELFQNFRELLEQKEKESSHGAIHQAVSMVERRYQEELTLEMAARVCGYNKNYFCRIFKETYGCSFVEYLTRFRMEKAKQLLQGGLPVNQAAGQVGMEYRQFCRTFKRFYGSTPSVCKGKYHGERRRK